MATAHWQREEAHAQAAAGKRCSTANKCCGNAPGACQEPVVRRLSLPSAAHFSALQLSASTRRGTKPVDHLPLLLANKNAIRSLKKKRLVPWTYTTGESTYNVEFIACFFCFFPPINTIISVLHLVAGRSAYNVPLSRFSLFQNHSQERRHYLVNGCSPKFWRCPPETPFQSIARNGADLPLRHLQRRFMSKLL